MSLSFACPACKVKIEVGDEFAGQTGRCPRCEHVFVIPTAAKPPIPVAKPVGEKPTPVPPADPWAKEPPRDEEKPRPRERPRRTRPTPQPSGPLWPWLVGVLGALIVIALLFSSLLVLTLWRKSPTGRVNLGVHPVASVRVLVGRLDGQRGFLDDGVFQVRSELTLGDPIDPRDPVCHVRRFDVELLPGRNYLIEQDSEHFDSRVRVDHFGQQMIWEGAFGQPIGQIKKRNVSLRFTPRQAGVHTITATSAGPGLGPYTLTIREERKAKPVIP